MAKGLSTITSLDTAIKECQRKSDVHAKIAVAFGIALFLITASVLVFLATLIITDPVDADKQTPALYALLPTLAIIAAFLASLSRFHLRTMTRWNDYGLAFSRVKLAPDSSHSKEQTAALLAATFATVSAAPELEVSSLVTMLKQLSMKPTKPKTKGDG